MVARFQFIVELLQRCFVWSKNEHSHNYNHYTHLRVERPLKFPSSTGSIIYITYVYKFSLRKRIAGQMCVG